MTPSILVTGFEPFGGEVENPSSWLLNKIENDPQLSAHVKTLLLPVSFEQASQSALRALEGGDYKCWIGFGQAGGRSKICLERVALNWIEADIPDNQGLHPKPGPLRPSEPPASFSQAPLETLKVAVQATGVPVEISFSAGAYVCNALYFDVLRHLPREMWGVFVHVPYLTSQVVNRFQIPALSKEDLWKGAEALLSAALRA